MNDVIEYLPENIVLCVRIRGDYVLNIIKRNDSLEFVDMYSFDGKTEIMKYCSTLNNVYQKYGRSDLKNIEILKLIKEFGTDVYNSIKTTLDYIHDYSVKNVSVTTIPSLQQQSGIPIYSYDLCFFETLLRYCQDDKIRLTLEKEIELYKIVCNSR